MQQAFILLLLTATISWGQHSPRRAHKYPMLSIDPSKVVTQTLTSAMSDKPLPDFQPTFYVQGRTLFDPCGSPVVLKGVNRMVYFDNADPEGQISFPQIAKTGANCVRIVWQMRDDSTKQPSDTQRLDRIITNARTQGLVPIVGLWDYAETSDGGFSKLSEYAAYWTRPDVVNVIQKHQEYLIINIANEAGNDGENDANELATYTTTYKQVIQQLRGAGIQVPLMIDGMDRGKSLHCFVVKGPELLKADPKHNLIFSFHPYWPKLETDSAGGAQFIKNSFDELWGVKIVMVMGEIAKYGAYINKESNPCGSEGIVDYMQFIRQADVHNMGWLIWEWGPGNFSKTNGDCNVLDMTDDRMYASLAAIDPSSPRYWMRELAIDSPYSIKKTAVRTTFISSGFVRCFRINFAKKPKKVSSYIK